MFGATAQSQGGGLFGSTANKPGGLFAASTTPSQPQSQQAGGLFGSNSAVGQQPQQGSSLFSSLGGSQQQQNVGLFGTAAAASQPQQAQQQSGGLFGTAATTTAAQPAGHFGQTATMQGHATGGMFGQAAQQQIGKAGSLFGQAASTTTETSTGAGLFSGQGQQQIASGGMFGQQQRPAGTSFSATHQPQMANSTLGASAFGQSTTQQQQQQQQQTDAITGVRIDVGNLRGTTRFNDLQQELQTQFTVIDRVISNCVAHANELDAFMPAHGEQLSAIPADVVFVTRKAEGMASALASDTVVVDQLRELIRQDTDNARLSFKAVDNLKLPVQYHQAGLWHTRGQQVSQATGIVDVGGESNADLVGYFSKTAIEMDAMMRKLKGNLSEIELHVHGLQLTLAEQLQRVSATPKNVANGGTDEKIADLAFVLRDFEESILNVAGVVGGAREGMSSLQVRDVFGNGLL